MTKTTQMGRFQRIGQRPIRGNLHVFYFDTEHKEIVEQVDIASVTVGGADNIRQARKWMQEFLDEDIDDSW